MARGEVVRRRVRLLKATMARPVATCRSSRLAEELWDPSGTRLDLADSIRVGSNEGCDPARKTARCSKPAGLTALVIDRGLARRRGGTRSPPSNFDKTFRAGPADETQPDPKSWAIARPAPSTGDPLVLTFPEPLDRALLESGLVLVDAKDRPVPGRDEVDHDQRRWRFTPDRPWVAGQFHLLIDPDLEDLAGNSVRRPFEVDIQRDTPSRPEARTVRLPVVIDAP